MDTWNTSHREIREPQERNKWGEYNLTTSTIPTGILLIWAIKAMCLTFDDAKFLFVECRHTEHSKQ